MESFQTRERLTNEIAHREAIWSDWERGLITTDRADEMLREATRRIEAAGVRCRVSAGCRFPECNCEHVGGGW